MKRSISFLVALTISFAAVLPTHAQKPRSFTAAELYEEIAHQVGHCLEVKVAGGECEVKAYVVAIELPPPAPEQSASVSQKQSAEQLVSDEQSVSASEEQPAPATETSIKIVDNTKFTAVEIQCENGFRSRAYFVGPRAVFTDVPDEDCSVFFKGGAPAKAAIRGGQHKSCYFLGATSNCHSGE